MSNSKLVKYTRLSPNCTKPRNHKIDKITIHHTAMVCGLATLGRVFAPTARRASSNYGISNWGNVGMYVEEKNRAWTSSNSANDHRAVTIEVSNSARGDDWPVSAKAYATLIDLCEDICRRNGIKKLVYTGDSSGNLTEHRMFAATACPGPYLHKRMSAIAKAVNDRLAVGYTGAFPVDTVSRTTGTITDIKRWQGFLCWYGTDVAVDGRFGPDTEAKTKIFQKAVGLEPDGSVGPKARTAAKAYRR